MADIAKTEVDIVPSVVDVDINPNDDIQIIQNRREYAIVSDAYLSSTGDSVPQWVYDVIDNTVDLAVDGATTEAFEDIHNRVDGVLDTIAGNNTTYVNRFIVNESATESVAADVSVLQANYNSANARIGSIEETYATEDRAEAITIETINAELTTGNSTNLKGYIDTIKNVVIDANSALATAVTALQSTIEDDDTGLYANAAAIESMQTYVGTDSASANYDQSLSAYLKGTDGKVGGADSKVSNLVYTDAQGNIKSKWEYGSTINLNGQTYTNGFGIKATGADSEFWINANKFRVTDPSRTDGLPVFSIVGNDVNFTGKVSFNSISDSASTIPTIGSVTTAQTTANSKSKTFRQTSIPTSVSVGDIWIDTDDSNKMYVAAIVGANEIKAGEWELSSTVVPDTSPEATITSTSTPGSTVKRAGTIWRYQPNASITKYIHYVSQGGGIWTEIGGTYIDGSSLVTGTIDANRIAASSITADKINTNGLIADDINTKTLYGTSIYGGFIHGGLINGAIITASYIDLTAAKGVSDWAGMSYTNYQTLTDTQKSRFIKDGSTGNVVVFPADGNSPVEYVKLPTTIPVVWSPVTNRTSISDTYGSYNVTWSGAVYVDFVSYDDYTSSNCDLRCKSVRPALSFNSQELVNISFTNDRWQYLATAIKFYDKVLVYTKNDVSYSWKIYTAAGFPEYQTKSWDGGVVADGNTYLSPYNGTLAWSYGTATVLASGTNASVVLTDANTNNNMNGLSITIAYQGETYGEDSFIPGYVKISLSNTSWTPTFNLTTSSSYDKAFGILFTATKAGHDNVTYVVTQTVPSVTAR